MDAVSRDVPYMSPPVSLGPTTATRSLGARRRCSAVEAGLKKVALYAIHAGTGGRPSRGIRCEGQNGPDATPRTVVAVSLWWN